MAIRLCHSCAREVNEGDKTCKYCGAILDQDQAIIEVVSDDIGFSFGANKNAYEDEALKNFKQDQSDINYVERKTESMLLQHNRKDDILDESSDEIFEDELEEDNIYDVVTDIIKNPNDYKALYIGIISCILLVIGIMSPMYYSIGGAVHYIYQKDMYYTGLFVMLLITISFGCVVKGRHKFVIIPSIFLVTVLIYLLNCISSIEYYSKLSFGFYIIGMASVMLIMSTLFIDNNSKKTYNKNIPLCKKDLSWILFTLFIAVVCVVRFADENVYDEKTDSIKTDTNETLVKIVVDDGNVQLNIKETFILRNNNKDTAVVKMTLYNNRAQAVSFNEVFTITVYQNDKILEPTEDIGADFDLTTSGLLVAAGSSQNVYFGYTLESQDDVEVIVYRNSSNEIVYDESMGFNEEFYDSKKENKVTQAPTHKIETEKPVQKDVNKEDNTTSMSVSEQPSATANPPSSQENVDTDTTNNITNDNNDSQKEEEVVQTTKPPSTAEPIVTLSPTKEASSWDIYFSKPSNWGDTVYIYMYVRDDTTGELKNENGDEKGKKGWPGQKMIKVSDNLYKFTYNQEWYKVGRCLFSDGKNQYPAYGEDKATGIWMTGNLNVSVPQ